MKNIKINWGKEIKKIVYLGFKVFIFGGLIKWL